MGFIDFAGKCFVVVGLANKKSVAFFVTRELLSLGAEVILVVRSEERRTNARKLFPQCHGVKPYP